MDARTGVIHPEIEGPLNNNQFLRALFNMKSDWFVQSFPAGELKNLRNAATHRGLILHAFSMMPDEPEPTSSGTDDFRKTVRFMLQLTKAAIIYSILVVDLEEARRENDNDAKIFSHEFRLRKGFADEDW